MKGKFVEFYAKLHANRPGYGRGDCKATIQHARQAVIELDARIALDYGCGKSDLHDQLMIDCDRYDPAIPGIDVMPTSKYDLVTCCDVLEHVPTDEIYPLLNSIANMTSNAMFVVHHGRARTRVKLPNGGNIHCTRKGRDWWRDKIAEVFGHCEVRPARIHRLRTIYQTWMSV